MPAQTVAIPVDPATAEELPTDPAERQEVLVLGLREWRLRRALETVRRGEASLARAAELAGISLREMIPLAFAHGLAPRVPAELLAKESLSLDEAAHL